MRRLFKYLFFFFLFIFVCGFLLSFEKIPEKISYGISFSKYHSDELQIPWKDAYIAMLDDLKVKQLRLSAHWPMIEPEKDVYNFADLDFQMEEAKKAGAKVILAVGRRLPGWPECHKPRWLWDSSRAEEQKELLVYIEAVVNRYKNFPNIDYWQVENEAFFGAFANEHCGEFNKAFFEEEMELVRKLDPSRKILMTDSGEFGEWWGSYQAGDAFGSTLYIYVWSKQFGPVKYPMIPAWFRIRQNFSALLFGSKPTILVELGAEPWLTRPIIEASIEEQLTRMDSAKFDEILSFASKTGFEKQYLWGAEWWYYMKEKGHPEFWNKARGLF